MPSAAASRPQHPNPYWRVLLALLAFQAVVWALAALLGYAIASPEMARDYYGAHRSVRTTWDLLAPALAAAAAAGFLLGGIGIGVGLRLYSRRLCRPLVELDGVLSELARGRIPAPAPGRPSPQGGAVESAAVLLAPLRERVDRIGQHARDLQKAVLELNYKASGSVEITLKDLRAAAGQLDALSRNLSEELKWFER